MIVMSTASKGLKASVIFSDRHTDRTWEEEKNALCRISHQIFNRLRMLKNAEKDQRELNRKLNYDALTGLPVYNKFVDKLEAYMAANGKVGLYFVSSDFSNFQYVNEMYGYEVGDRILHDFAVEGRQCRRNLHGQDPQRFGEYQNNCIRNGKRL